jgi:hypothetical protein
MTNTSDEWMQIAMFMVEAGYRAPSKGLLSPVLDLPEIERDLRRKMAFVIIPDKPRLH